MEFPATATINITQQDIEEGLRGNCTKCPGALAAARAFPGCPVDVMHTTTYVDDPDSPLSDDDSGWHVKFVYYTNSPELSNFIKAFDQGHPVEPLTTTITLREDRWA